MTFILNENTVTRCSRLIEDHHSVLAQQAIDQGRLSHIGPAYHRNTNARSALIYFGIGVTKGQHHFGNHCPHTAVVGGSDGVQLGYT